MLVWLGLIKMVKQVKKYKLLEVTENDIAVAFWYEDGSKEIIVISKDAIVLNNSKKE